MCLNVFIIIVIEFHHHFLIVTFLHTFFFTLYNDSLPNMLYHYVLFFPFPLIHSNFHTIYPYFSRLYITLHSTFHIPHSMSSLVARSKAEPKFKLYLSLSGLLVHKGGLNAWNEVATSKSLLVTYTPHHQCKEKYENHSLCTQIWELEVEYGLIGYPFSLLLIWYPNEQVWFHT
jgi:hypothetical protein